MLSQDPEPIFHDPSIKAYPRFTTTSADYAHSLYRNSAADSDIEAFLSSTPLYDIKNRTWLSVGGMTTTATLVKTMRRIATSIVGQFVASSPQPGVSRRVVSVYQVHGNQAKDADGYWPYPNLVIQASGPSFEDIPATEKSKTTGPTIGDTHLASFFVVKLDSDSGTAEQDVSETEKYAKFIFQSQPNRIYVRCLVVTQKHARLLHLDRAGAQVTPLIDIHEQAATFVRLVAGLASVDERLLGFDDSVQWTIVEGKKDQGTLTTRAPDGTMKVYPIIGQIPVPFQTYWGRGTVCWRVRDPDTSEELVVKDSWRHEDRPSEHEFLELCKDLPGVVQMVSFETGRGETKDYRCASTTGHYPNRVAMRIVMKSYGKSVEFFTSALQLLCAIRDAIAGHQRLVDGELKILHRDISHNNILFGKEGAKVGDRGVLIDFDAAFKATDDEPTVKADYHVGTRIFQSITVLNSYSCRRKTPAHDYLDDLESFFYVVVYLFLIHMPDGTRVSCKSEGPTIVAKWNRDHPSIAFCNKDDIFGNRDSFIALKFIERNWGPVCIAFYRKLKSWMSDLKCRKFEIVIRTNDNAWNESDDEEDEEDEDDFETLEELHSHRDDHYSEVLSIFDEAIEALQAPAPSDVVCTTPTALGEAADVLDTPASADNPVVGRPLVSPPNTGNRESSSPPSAAVEVVSSGPASPAETTPSTAPPSLETPAPTTPPDPVTSAVAVHSNQANSLKRRAEDDTHPECPPTKGRRIGEDVLVAPS